MHFKLLCTPSYVLAGFLGTDPRVLTPVGSSPAQHLISFFHQKRAYVSEHMGELRETSSFAHEETQTGTIILCCCSAISHFAYSELC